MKKIGPMTAAALAAAALCTVARADVKFRWLPDASSLLNNGGTAIAQTNATVLTYLSGDQTIDFGYDGLLLPSYGAGPGADTYIGEGRGNASNGRYSTTWYQPAGNEYVGDYVYAIVLDLPFADFTTLNAVPVGTRYGVTTIGTESGVNKALVAYDSFNAAATSTSFKGGGVNTTLQTIPEPSGVALVAVGLGAVALRRRLGRKRA